LYEFNSLHRSAKKGQALVECGNASLLMGFLGLQEFVLLLVLGFINNMG